MVVHGRPDTLGIAEKTHMPPGQLAELVLVDVVGQWHAAPSDRRHLLACSSSPVHERGWPLSAQPDSHFSEAQL